MSKDRSCGSCTYAIWDYDSFEGGAKKWFLVGCEKALDEPDGDCDEYKEWESDED